MQVTLNLDQNQVVERKKREIVKINCEHDSKSWETGKGDHDSTETVFTVMVDGRQYKFRYYYVWHELDNNTSGTIAYQYQTDGAWQACPGDPRADYWWGVRAGLRPTGANPCTIDGMEINQTGSALYIDGQKIEN